jgi:YfiH family protein
MGIVHGVSTRLGGVSSPPYASLNLSLAVGDERARVSENRRRWCKAVGVAAERVAQPRLVHGAAVVRLRAAAEAPGIDAPLDVRADGAITDQPGLPLLMTFADCLPVLIADRRAGAIGLAHAGWRGTLAGVVGATVAAMAEAFGSRPHELLVGLGPCIRACCYVVGPDVVAAARAALPDDAAAILVQGEHGNVCLDLPAANRRILERAGVEPAAIVDAGLCTRCHSELFFSHRAAGGPTGRGAAIIARP